ncbi:MAG: dUTP diphosphatase [Verrucomicrobia bacterium]|nr:dUTP diphosphatase [Verrucomicrobiota bacterium]MBS0636295.1 dUTP diphosphatase [Verrucomicrobiota bacterium]
MSSEDIKYVDIKYKAKDEELLPVYSTPGAAGADLRACIDEPIVISAHSAKLIPTGLFLEIPPGFEVQVRPRSGLALKSQITVLNSPGTIDSDYRGELQVILMNHSEVDFMVTPGMRIAQMVVARALQAHFVPVEELATSVRGSGGFGHTGTN